MISNAKITKYIYIYMYRFYEDRKGGYRSQPKLHDKKIK